MGLPEDFRQEAERICDMVSWGYARRCWWVEQPEVLNECWTIALEVWRDYGECPEQFWGGAKGFGTVVYVACMRQIGRKLRRWQAAANSSGDNELKEMSEGQRRNSAHLLSLECKRERADDVLALEQLRGRIRKRIFQLCGRSPEVEASALVFLDGYTPKEVVAELGVDVNAVYRWNEVVRGVSRADKEIRTLAKELAVERSWT